MANRWPVTLGLLSLLFASCGWGELQGDGTHKRRASTDDGFCAAPPSVHAVAGSTIKLSQLTGERDREWGKYTVNRTESRHQLFGTDLGASFEHDGRLWFLFGDSIETPTHGRHPKNGDSIAYSTDSDPSDGVSLNFVSYADGAFRAPIVPGIDLGEFNVPLDGVSAGGSMYVWFSTDRMMRSILARSDDNAQTFQFVHDLSNQHFVNVSAEVVPAADTAGLPAADGDRVLLFGSGDVVGPADYRHSNVYLAATSLGQIDDRGALRFFAGTDSETCAPRWSEDENAAVPLFNQPCVGELSVSWNQPLGVWLMLYNCDNQRGINMRTARQPWGPWSEPEVLFDPWRDGGYCHFMHAPGKNCDAVNDAGREADWGGEYGPYLISRFMRGGGGRSTITYTLSTWNPYNVVVMRSELMRTDKPSSELPSDAPPAPGGAASDLAATNQVPSSDQPGRVKVQFSWTSSGKGDQWLDLSLQDNNFAENTFLGQGPIPSGQNSTEWDGLEAGLVHYVRLNTLTASGWEVSPTLTFKTIVP